MTNGYVKWFNYDSGYGYIDWGDTVPDAYVDYSDLDVIGYLKPGDRVTFALDGRGLHGQAPGYPVATLVRRS